MKNEAIDLEQDLADYYQTRGYYTTDVDLWEVSGKLLWEACRDIREKGDGFQGKLEELKKNPAFAEHEGRIYFWLESKFRGREWSYIGRIPAEVQAQGEDAIQRHVELRKNAKLDPLKKQIDEDDRFGESSNVEVAIDHDGHTLRGKILSGNGRYFVLRMEYPYHVEASQLGGYNQWSAQSGIFMFSRDRQGNLCYSEDCLKRAREELISMYKIEKNREHHPNVISTANRLNRR